MSFATSCDLVTERSSVEHGALSNDTLCVMVQADSLRSRGPLMADWTVGRAIL